MDEDMEEIPREFWLGVEQFNQRQFYDCHDTLEALWMDAIEPEKRFYQGVLQIAVALHHLGNHNWRGAVILLGEGINRLRHYQPVYAEVDVSQLLNQAADVLATLQQAGAEGVADLVQLEGGDRLTSTGSLTLPVILRVEEGMPSSS
jgi:predicted metal-dependent hydrolase